MDNGRLIFMALTNKERKTLKNTRLRNLKRKYAKMIQDPSLIEECIELKAEIDGLEMEIKAMKQNIQNQLDNSSGEHEKSNSCKTYKNT